MKEQTKGQATQDRAGRDKSDIISQPGVSSAENYLERGWHCEECHLELTSIEKLLYGDFCVFHTESRPKPFSLLKKLYMAYLDWKIYNLLVSTRKTFENIRQSAYYYIIGVLATLGLQHIGAAHTIRLKKMLITEIKELIKNAREGKIQKLRGSSQHTGREEEKGLPGRGKEEEHADFNAGPEEHAEVSRLRNQLAQEEA